jgi:iron complex transport system substrate-binding protein
MTGPAGGPRVVSLIASGTEIVAGLGMVGHLVGRSHSCDHPPAVRELPVLTEPKMDPSRASGSIDRDVRTLVEEGLSVYRIDVDALARLRPDVIVTQDHCQVCAVSLSDVQDALAALDLPGVEICSLQPTSLDDVRDDLERVAAALGVTERGRELRREFDRGLEAVAARTRGRDRPRVTLVEWLDPPMVAGHWMPELCRIAGGAPVRVTRPVLSPTVPWSEIADDDPARVVVLPCGFDVSRSLGEMEAPPVSRGLASVAAVRRGRCTVVDGHAFMNRPGPRLVESARLLATAIHPGAFPDWEEELAAYRAPEWQPDRPVTPGDEKAPPA